MEDVQPTWHELHGSKNWDGLLHPLRPSLRDLILKYGNFSEASYEAYDGDQPSGRSRYDPGSLLNAVGLGESGYKVTGYLYATMAELPSPPLPLGKGSSSWLRKLLRVDTLSEDRNWMGFVAVSDEDKSHRRDILVAWRGTVEPSEWFKDAQWRLEPLKAGAASGAMVEHGFQSIYTSSSSSSRTSGFNKSSASEQMKTEIRRLIDSWKEEVTLTITGHSLGGALALLSAHDAAASISGLKHVSVISFGAPQVGDAAFVKELANKGVKVLRVVNKEDKVPKLPRLVDSRYQHAGVELELAMNGQAGGETDLAAYHRLKTYLRLVEAMKSSAAATPAPALSGEGRRTRARI